MALIDNRAFYKCAGLRALRIEPGSALQLVGRNAFGRTQLDARSVRFPDQTFVEPTAFEG